MKNSFDEKILEEAQDWLSAKRNVILATVTQTWGSSPRPVGSRMIVNDKGELIGLLHSVFIKMNVVVVSVNYDDLRAFAHKGIRNHKKDRYNKILLPDTKFKL